MDEAGLRTATKKERNGVFVSQVSSEAEEVGLVGVQCLGEEIVGEGSGA